MGVLRGVHGRGHSRAASSRRGWQLEFSRTCLSPTRPAWGRWKSTVPYSTGVASDRHHLAHSAGNDLIRGSFASHDAQRLASDHLVAPPSRRAARPGRGLMVGAHHGVTTGFHVAGRSRRLLGGRRGLLAATGGRLGLRAAGTAAAGALAPACGQRCACPLPLRRSLRRAALLGNADQLANLIDVHVIVLSRWRGLLLQHKSTSVTGACSNRCRRLVGEQGVRASSSLGKSPISAAHSIVGGGHQLPGAIPRSRHRRPPSPRFPCPCCPAPCRSSHHIVLHLWR